MKTAAAAVGVHLVGPREWEKKIAHVDDKWRAPHENAAAQLTRHADAVRCPRCGQPANLIAARQTIVTDAQTGRTSAVIERHTYCPSAFHVDAPQRTGEETI